MLSMNQLARGATSEDVRMAGAAKVMDREFNSVANMLEMIQGVDFIMPLWGNHELYEIMKEVHAGNGIKTGSARHSASTTCRTVFRLAWPHIRQRDCRCAAAGVIWRFTVAHLHLFAVKTAQMKR